MAKFFEVRADQLADLFRRVERQRPDLIRKGVRLGCAAGAEALATISPMGVTGEFKRSIHAEHGEKASMIVIDVPYAAVYELGSRPHWAPYAAIEGWVRWKFGVQGSELRRITQAVRAKIAREGTRPHFFVRKRLPELRRILKAEVEAVLAAEEPTR